MEGIGVLMNVFGDLSVLLERAISAFKNRDFLSANEIFEAICSTHPDNWISHYFYGMSLCATGDFSEARAKLNYILLHSNEALWWQTARGGLALVDAKEKSFRRYLAGLI